MQKARIVETNAVLSKDRKYRYWLMRRWSADKSSATFIMLNPSMADELVDDPTIRRCIGFAKYLGFDSIEVVNLFAYRATKPEELRKVECPVADPQWPECNDSIITHAARRAAMTICAWGNTKYANYLDRQKIVLRNLRSAGVTPFALRVNDDGTPSHPLYLKYGDPFPL